MFPMDIKKKSLCSSVSCWLYNSKKLVKKLSGQCSSGVNVCFCPFFSPQVKTGCFQPFIIIVLQMAILLSSSRTVKNVQSGDGMFADLFPKLLGPHSTALLRCRRLTP